MNKYETLDIMLMLMLMCCMINISIIGNSDHPNDPSIFMWAIFGLALLVSYFGKNHN